MATMKEQRIVGVLKELSKRVSEYNTAMSDLIDDFNLKRRAPMQIRKRAQKCVAMACIVISRFTSIASSACIDRDSELVKVFNRRCEVFTELELFFH